MEAAIKGENPYTFRVAETQLDPSSPTPSVRVNSPVQRTLDAMVGLEPTFSAHKAVTGMPFPATFFSLDKVYSHMNLEEKVHINKVETYLGNELKSRRFNDSARAAGRLLGELQKKLGLNEDHDPYYQLERMSRHLDALRVSRSYNQNRKQLLGFK